MAGNPQQNKKGIRATRNMVLVAKLNGKRSVGRGKC